MMAMTFRSLTAFVLILISMSSFSFAQKKADGHWAVVMGERVWIEPNQMTFGPEFEFTSSDLRHYPSPGKFLTDLYIYPGEPEQKAIKQFKGIVVKKCKTLGCKAEAIKCKFDLPGYRITFPDGWYFEITPDAWTVEILAKPQTIPELEARKDLMNQMIFATAREMGLKARGADILWGYLGVAAGHLNFGSKSAFGDSGREWLRYFVDYANHPEFVSGTIHRDFINAPPFSALRKDQKEALTSLANAMSNGKDLPIHEVAEKVIERVYTYTPFVSGEAFHYQAMGVKNVPKMRDDPKSDKPTEHRGMPAQENAEEFILEAKMYEARRNFLKTQVGEPIVFLPTDQTSFSEQELVSRFAIYLEEARLKLDDYRRIMLEKLRGVPADDFVLENWGSKKTYKAALTHLPYAMTSQLVRDKLFRYLTSKEIGYDAPDIISKLIDLTRDTKYSAAGRAQIVKFFMTLRRTKTFSHLVIDRDMRKLLQSLSLLDGAACSKVWGS